MTYTEICFDALEMKNYHDWSERIHGPQQGSSEPNPQPSQIAQSSSLTVYSACLVPYESATTSTSSLLFALPNLLHHGAHVHIPILTYTDNSNWVNTTRVSIYDTALAISSASFKCNECKDDSGDDTNPE